MLVCGSPLNEIRWQTVSGGGLGPVRDLQRNEDSAAEGANGFCVLVPVVRFDGSRKDLLLILRHRVKLVTARTDIVRIAAFNAGQQLKSRLIADVDSVIAGRVNHAADALFFFRIEAEKRAHQSAGQLLFQSSADERDSHQQCPQQICSAASPQFVQTCLQAVRQTAVKFLKQKAMSSQTNGKFLSVDTNAPAAGAARVLFEATQ